MQIWTKLSEFEFDFDSDGINEKLELLAEVEHDNNGNILWNDGQEWLVVIEDGTKFYSLFSEYVQLGNVYFTVAQEEGKNVITIIISTSSRLEMIKYIYDKNKQVFQEEPAYISPETNYLFTSIPDYK